MADHSGRRRSRTAVSAPVHRRVRVACGAGASAGQPRHAVGSVEQLVDEPLILPPPGPSRAIVDQAFRARGFEPRVSFEATDPMIRIALASEGLGLALASERTPSELHPLYVEGVSMQHSAVLAWTERGLLTRATAVFVEFATSWTREHTGLIDQANQRELDTPA